MKNKFKILIIIVLSSLVTACSVEPKDLTENIINPEPSKYILDGIWKLDKLLYRDEKGSMENLDHRQDERAYFKGSSIFIDGRYSNKSEYKLKRVNSRKYLISNYNIYPKALEIEEEEIRVINIYEDGNFILEIFLLSEDQILYIDGDEYLFFKLESSDIEDRIVERELNKGRIMEDYKNTYDNDAGLMLGIRYYEQDYFKGNGYKYKTLYIKYSGGAISLYEVDDLVIPRKNGFYKMSMEDIGRYPERYTRMEIWDMENKIHKEVLEKNIYRKIVYVGNDYISMEDQRVDSSRLSVVPLDYIDRGRAIKMSDILSPDEMKRARDSVDYPLDESNFGLSRSNGYWRLLAREDNYLDNKIGWKDYTLPVIPPKSVVNYDRLWLTWNYIKSFDKNAQDAFVSPNREIIVIDKKEAFDVYRLDGESIIGDKILSIDKEESQEIIMSEWALGNYVNTWSTDLENIFKANKK